jgi:asparagine synthase (glutamine-hydrolysing)
MGMSASIESRFPFLDEDVVRFGLNLPVRHKIRRTRTFHDKKHPFLQEKAVVRAAGEALLPPSLAHKPKEGFPMFGHKNVRVEAGAFVDGYVSALTGLTRAGEARMLDSADPYFVGKLVSTEVFGRLFELDEPVDEVAGWLSRCVRVAV